MRGIIVMSLLVALLSGCATSKLYSDLTDKNFHIRTQTDSRELFSSVKVTLHLYRVGRGCHASYLGSVKLDKPGVQIGIEPGEVSYLSFEFHRGGFLSSSSGTTSYDTLIKPRRGYHYDVVVNYDDAIYSVNILEKRMSGEQGREVPVKSLAECGM